MVFFYWSDKLLDLEEVNYLFEVVSYRYFKVELELYVLNDSIWFFYFRIIVGKFEWEFYWI